jgi:hypothetical protein
MYLNTVVCSLETPSKPDVVCSFILSYFVEEVFCNSILGFPLNVFVVRTRSILPNPAIHAHKIHKLVDVDRINEEFNSKESDWIVLK